MSTRMRALLFCVALLSCSNAFAQATSPQQRPAEANTVTVAKVLVGGALGLGLHESGHLVFDEAFGADPGMRRVSFGGIPFFAITHSEVSPVREFTISSAGFWVQHVTDEMLLSSSRDLRHRHAPLLKGWLAFNVLTSVGYAGAAFARTGPLERDTRGIAASAGVAEPWIGAAILAPAALDAMRYFHPESRVLKWASRATKIGGALLVVKAAR